MKLEIHKLLDSWQENEVELSEEADLAKIRSKTLEKVREERKRRPFLRYGLIAVAVVILLVGSVYAAYRSISIAEKTPGETVLFDDGEMKERIYFSPDHVITVASSGTGNMVGFRPGYLPEGDMTPIRFTLKGDVSYFYSEEEAAAIASDVLTETNTSIRNQQENSTWDMLYDIRLLNSARIYRQELSLNGEVSVIKEGELGDYDAIWLTLDRSHHLTAILDGEEQYTLRNAPVQNILLLYSEEYDCLIRIAGNSELLSFEELERIATELELVGTNLPAKAAEWSNSLNGSVG